MNALELRAKATEVLARARDDDEFRQRIRTETAEVLREEGILEDIRRTNGLPEVEAADETVGWCYTSCEVTSCADYTCFLTVCPESCFPGVIATIYMQPLYAEPA